jgi:hypothetical protein
LLMSLISDIVACRDLPLPTPSMNRSPSPNEDSLPIGMVLDEVKERINFRFVPGSLSQMKSNSVVLPALLEAEVRNFVVNLDACYHGKYILLKA